MSDSSLCRSLLRVYLLGGGLCTSLEEAGKMVRAELPLVTLTSFLFYSLSRVSGKRNGNLGTT